MLRIEQVLYEQGLSQSKAARLADVNQTSFSRIVRGKEPAYSKRGQRIADALGWTGDWRELFEELEAEAPFERETCKDMSGGDPCVFVCSECAAVCNHPYDEAIRYCPNCGRKVVGA